MSLRDVAAVFQQERATSTIGQLIAQLDKKQAAEVDDLLFGEPRIGHRVVAKVLNQEFGDVLARTVSEKMVQEYRARER